MSPVAISAAIDLATEEAAFRMDGSPDGILVVTHAGPESERESHSSQIDDALLNRGISFGRIRHATNATIATNPSPNASPNKPPTRGVTMELVQEIRSSSTIQFRPCSSDLDLDDAPTSSALRSVSCLLRTLPHHFITVEGHTDSRPNPFGTNLQLSQERADAVKTHLTTKLSVPVRSLTTTGYGDTRPLLPETTYENRSANRRVSFLVSTSSTIRSILEVAGTASKEASKEALRNLKKLAVDRVQPRDIRHAAASVLLSAGKGRKVANLMLCGARKGDPDSCMLARLPDDVIREILKLAVILGCL